MEKNELFKNIAENVIYGKSDKVKSFVEECLNQNVMPKDIIDNALIKGMEIVGEKFKNNEFFIPEMLIAARAMKTGMEILEPLISAKEKISRGKVVIGTVQGDLHDIGKNLVAVMLKGAGYEVVDLGIDVSADKFINASKETNADIVAMSALLTTTMVKMKDIVSGLNQASFSGKTMIGGAPITKEYAKEIGAQLFAPDAASAVDVVKSSLGK